MDDGSSALVPAAATAAAAAAAEVRSSSDSRHLGFSEIRVTESQSIPNNEESVEKAATALKECLLDRLGEQGKEVLTMFDEYEGRRKEKRELERCVESLTEENRDVRELLRVAVVEKESMEKRLDGVRGDGEQKRMAILEIAGRGLQRVGFGFVMGYSGGECGGDGLGSSASVAGKVSDGSDVEEEEEVEVESNSLATTFETMVKKLRHEITELRKSLDESRSISDHLQSLTAKQADEINEKTICIKALEESERLLKQNVRDLNIKIKEAEEEVLRWREACELEVEAGKYVTQEHERKSSILREDLARTKTLLDDASKKLLLKEKLATTAMVAHAAVETSLRMADRRSVVLVERIEELTKQLEEESDQGRKYKGRNRLKIRHVCWPWHAFKIINPSSYSRGPNRNPRRRIPEMMALLQ